MKIEDGTGSQAQAGVTSKNKLQTRSVSVSALHEASLNGDAYSWNAVSADVAAAATALLVRNDSDTRHLVIEKVYVYSDVATAVDVHFTNGAVFTAAGTAVTGVNLNRGVLKVADATSFANETGNTQGNIFLTLHTSELTTSQEGVEYNFDGAVILGRNGAIGLDLVADSAAFECTIIGYFVDM